MKDTIRIAIDLSPLQRWDNRFRGIGTYIFNLINRIVLVDKRNDYVFLLEKGKNYHEIHSWINELKQKSSRPISTIELPAIDYFSFSHQLFMNRLAKKNHIDILHIPVQGKVPFLRNYKVVITLAGWSLL